MSGGNAVLLYDANGNPVSLSANTALASGQPAVVAAGSDYGGAAKAQIPRVDASGTQYVAQTNPAGGSALYAGGQPPGALASQYGTLMMARQDLPAPSAMVPLTADMTGALNVHPKSKQTFRAIAAGVSCAANKSLFSLIYANSGTQVLRINEISIYVPPSGSSGGGGLLGSSSTAYYPVICELRRITTATGGTAVTPVSGDTADVLTSGIGCATGAAVSATVSTWHRADAVISTSTGLAWFARLDPNEKTFVLRPGEGFSITCVSSGVIISSSGSGTTTAVADLEVVFTQALA